ncbi:hypothetical protein ABT340_15660 [Streptosporangium sp. NPDC000239]|uniref:hypothetical protein n=1 Tax=Streptosporangium sp. NPDC000239 TaxID=3154248 RepID=UPI0033208141
MSEVNPQMTKGPSRHGPADPLRPVKDPEIMILRPDGFSVVRHAYGDGHIFEYAIPKGMNIGAETSYYTVPFFEGQVISAHSDRKASYVGVWIPRNPENTGSLPFEGAPMPFEFGHCKPVGEPQTLHESNNLFVIRVPYDGGWLYKVTRTLGIPWPNPMEVICLQDVVGNPVIGVEVNSLLYTTKFWIPYDRVPA